MRQEVQPFPRHQSSQLTLLGCTGNSPDWRRHPGHRKVGGFAAISAIFLIVILAAMGAFMLTFSNAQQLTSMQDIKGSRAYWAARAGLERGISQVVSGATPAAGCPATPVGLAVQGFSVSVECSYQGYVDGATSSNIYQITSTSSQGAVGTLGFVERSLTVSFEK